MFFENFQSIEWAQRKFISADAARLEGINYDAGLSHPDTPQRPHLLVLVIYMYLLNTNHRLVK